MSVPPIVEPMKESECGAPTKSSGDLRGVELPIRAIHASGNWSTNRQVADRWPGTGQLVPLDHLEWLESLYVNWVGISVALHYDDSMDSTIERVYSSSVLIPTFSDAALRQIIQDFRAHGIDVYLTLAFESHEAEDADRPVQRWQIGDPGHPDTGVPDDGSEYTILREFWPWNPNHPDHSRFVAEFWDTYTQQAVHFAKIAQDEGVRMYSIGTETDRLFRTRPGGERVGNEFRDELTHMVAQVRAVYDGLLTYDMHVGALEYPDFYLRVSDCLWEDLDLDIIGLSGWFNLVDMPPDSVMGVAELEMIYNARFRDHLIPLMEATPGRPIMFLEFGAVDVVSAPFEPAQGADVEFVHEDVNGNGVDDGRETQANMYQALLNTMQSNPGVVNGVFWWDNWIASDELWASEWANLRNFDIRDKPSEQVVRSAYESYSR